MPAATSMPPSLASVIDVLKEVLLGASLLCVHVNVVICVRLCMLWCMFLVFTSSMFWSVVSWKVQEYEQPAKTLLFYTMCSCVVFALCTKVLPRYHLPRLWVSAGTVIMMVITWKCLWLGAWMLQWLMVCCLLYQCFGQDGPPQQYAGYVWRYGKQLIGAVITAMGSHYWLLMHAATYTAWQTCLHHAWHRDMTFDFVTEVMFVTDKLGYFQDCRRASTWYSLDDGKTYQPHLCVCIWIWIFAFPLLVWTCWGGRRGPAAAAAAAAAARAAAHGP